MDKTFNKVRFSDYKGKYDENIKERMELSPESIDIETMRANLYGYTFTKGYTDGVIPDELLMDYWEEHQTIKECEDLAVLDFQDIFEEDHADDVYFDVSPQERLILETIDSTGDGKTPETALCVIDTHQEYEYIARVIRLFGLNLIRQSVSNGIDCLELKDHNGHVEKVYFDIKRRFEVGYLAKFSTSDAPET